MKLTKYFLLASILIIGVSCAHSDDYRIVEKNYQEWEVTKTILDIKNLATNEVQAYTEDDVIEGYVVSSDEGGVFYKSISFQNEDGTAGFSIPVDNYNLFSEVEIGRKVYIKLKGLYFMIKHDGLVIGDLYQGNDVGRLIPLKFKNHVGISKETKTEDELVKVLNITELKNNEHINTLVELHGVQFELSAVGKTFFDPNNAFGGATNYNLEQNINDEIKTIVFRTGQFAKFAQKTVPAEKGIVRGVLTKYNTTYQFSVRTYNDLNLTEERFHISTAIGGENMEFLANINENFSNFPANTTEFPIYGNDQTAGGRFWSVRSFSGNNYIQLNAYNNSAPETKSYFILPVIFNGNNSLSFKTKDGYYNGDVLNVYYTTVNNYTYGNLIQPNLYTNITDQFSYSSGTTGGYAQNFTESGVYQFPNSLTGNGYIIFEYSGTSSRTTTIQIDDIVYN